MRHAAPPRASRRRSRARSSRCRGARRRTPTNEINIDHVESGSGAVSMLLSVDGLPDGSVVDGETLSVVVDGNARRRRRSRPSPRATSSGRPSSWSTPATACRRATSSTPRSPPSTPSSRPRRRTSRSAWSTFAGKVKEQIAPSTDHAAVLAAVEERSSPAAPSVYDAIDAARELLGDEGARSLLVLSDGADTSSVDDPRRRLRRRGGRRRRRRRRRPAGGRRSPSRSAPSPTTPAAGSSRPTLTRSARVLSEQGDALAHQLRGELRRPRRSGRRGIDRRQRHQRRRRRSPTRPSSRSAPSTIAAPDVVETGKALVSTPVMLLGAVAVFLGLGGVLVVSLTGAERAGPVRSARLDSYFAGPTSSLGQEPQEGACGCRLAAPGRARCHRQGRQRRPRDTHLPAPHGCGVGPDCVGVAAAARRHRRRRRGRRLRRWVADSWRSSASLGGVVGPWIYLKWRHGRRLSRVQRSARRRPSV